MLELREVDPSNPQDLASATRLHLALFQNMGPMAQLGELVVRKFCYALLLRDGLMQAALCLVDGVPAGLIAYTARSITFHRTAVRNHWAYILWLVALSVLRDPRVILRLVKAARLMISRRKEQHLGSDPTAEVLAIGVLPEFRNPAFIRRTGLRISETLLRHAASYFHRAGLARMRMIVDADNTPTLLFYHSLGAQFERYEQAGVPSVLVWFDVAPLASVPNGPEEWSPELPTSWSSTPPAEPSDGNDQRLHRWDAYWEGLDDRWHVFRWEARDYVQRLVASVPLNTTMRVLDFGCGFGFVAQALAPNVGELFVWDASANMRRHARMNVAGRRNVRFLDLPQGDGRYSGCFDVILVNSVVQYMTADQFRQWLGCWRAMLVPGGRLVLSDLLPPGRRATISDLVALSGFSARHGFFLRAFREGLGELGRYKKMRTAYPLLRVEREDLRRRAAAAGFESAFLPRNLTYRAGRITAVLSRAAAPPVA